MKYLILTSLCLIVGQTAFGQTTYDAKILEYKGLKYACDNGSTPILKIRNEGSVTMSGCVVETWKNGLLVNTFDWQLAVPAAQGQVRQPAFPVVPGTEPGDDLEFRIKTVNGIPDEDPVGNIIQVVLDEAFAETASVSVMVKVETGDDPSGLTWQLRDHLGVLLASGGPYMDANTVLQIPVVLGTQGCYDFKALDTGRSRSVGSRVQVLSSGNTLFTAAGSELQAGFENGLTTGNGLGCSEFLVVELNTDASPDETTWEVVDQGSAAILCVGAGSYPAEATITGSCCLPIGCYRLRVLDAGGDGMTTGGYSLRTQGSNQRIIDNKNNFNGVFNGSFSAINGGQGFCLPIGTDKPIFSSCDKVDWVANKFIVASANPVVSAQFGVTNATSGYEFWFFDPNGSYSYRRFRSHATSDGFGTGATRACHFKVNGWINSGFSPHLPSNVLLNVLIRGRVAGNNLEFGPACRFKIDPALAACPRTNLQDNPANTIDFSCGVTRTFGGASSPSNRIAANPPQPVPVVASSSVRYQFRFRIPGESICIIRPPQTSATLVMNWTTGQRLECSKTYLVDVRASLNGGTSWCFDTTSPSCTEQVTPWGKVCSVNISTSTFCPSALEGGASNLATPSNGNLTMYPNPNRGDQLFISLSEVATDVSTVSVDIHDMTGKRVIARTIAVQNGYLKTAMELNGDLASGVYIVNITALDPTGKAGDKTYTERLVIQPN